MTDRETAASGLILITPPLPDGALEALLDGFRGQVVLVEPDPDRALRLQSRDGVRVIGAAIDREAGQKPLVRFNLPGLRSLFAPTAALRDALPGLREVGRTTVPVIRPDDLAQQLDDLPTPLTLHINAPGAEMMILQGLAAKGVLARVSHLHLHCGTEPMVEGAAPRADLEGWIVEQGFALAADTSDDPDWAELEFRVDLRARALDENRAALKLSEDTARKQQTQIAALELDRAGRDKIIAGLEAALATARKARDESDTALQQRDAALKSREDDLARVTGERDAALGQADQLGKRVTELETSVNAAGEALARAAQALAESENDRAERTQQVDKLEQNLTDSRAALKSREDDLAKMAGERDAARGLADQRSKRVGELEAAVNAARQAQAKSEHALAEAEKVRADKTTALTEKAQRIAALEQDLTNSRATLKSREADLAKMTGERDAARGQADQHSKRVTELETRVSTERQVAEQAKSDLGVALRMQMLAQSDLRDLQTRFREVEQARAAQQALLENLTPRLQQAARQLQQLHLSEGPAALDEKPVRSKPLTIANAPAKDKSLRKSSKKTSRK